MGNAVLRVAATAPQAVIEVADLPDVVRGSDRVTFAPAALPPLAPSGGSPPVAPADHARDALLRALEASSWNVARTAQVLQVSRMTLCRQLRKHKIER